MLLLYEYKTKKEEHTLRIENFSLLYQLLLLLLLGFKRNLSLLAVDLLGLEGGFLQAGPLLLHLVWYWPFWLASMRKNSSCWG